MSTIAASERAIENIEATYLAFGVTAGSTIRFEYEGLRVVVGPANHPLANFALLRTLTKEGLEALALAASQRRSLHIYLLSREEDPRALDALEVAGFQPSYTLEKMVAQPMHEQVEESIPSRADDPSERMRVSRFMVSHFFSGRPADFREVTASTLARSTSLELYSVVERGRLVAAVMLSRSPGAIGLYNLCVAFEKRERGLGSRLVAWARQVAKGEGAELTLQCRPDLFAWYSARGFASVGCMETFLAPKTAPLVTM